MHQAAMTTDEMDAVAKEFMAANPNIKVEMEYVPYDALHDKFVTAMATNPPPYDVIMVDVIWYDEFVKAGYLADVTSRITPDMQEKVFKTAWNVVTLGDKVYGMPWLLDTKYLYYNDRTVEAGRIRQSAQDLGRTGRSGQGHQGQGHRGLSDRVVVDAAGSRDLRLHGACVWQRRELRRRCR